MHYAEINFETSDSLDHTVSLSPRAAMTLYFAMIERSYQPIAAYGSYISSQLAESIALDLMRDTIHSAISDHNLQITTFGNSQNQAIIVAATGAQEYYQKLRSSHFDDDRWGQKLAVAQEVAFVLDQEAFAQQTVADLARIPVELA